MAREFPTGVRVLIDDEDVTFWLFGSDTIELSELEYRFEGIDLSPFASEAGQHTLKITCDAGVGRVEARLEIE